MKIQINTIDKSHHEKMIQFGLAGAAVGCVIGTALVPAIPRSENMYTVILPFSTTYIGLATGFFAAGVRKFLLTHSKNADEMRKVTRELPQLGKGLQASFANYDAAQAALTLLTAGGVAPKQVSVFGQDCDAFRRATAPLHLRRLDPLILLLSGIGFVIGSYWGYIGSPHLATTLPSVIMSALMAGFCGALLGLLAGAQIGAVVHLDNVPVSDAAFDEAILDNAVVAVSIQPASDEQAEFIQQILSTKPIEEAPIHARVA